MARKSRIEPVIDKISLNNYGVEKVGIYARLSNETSTEESLENQIQYLRNYVNEQSDMKVEKVYSDFGYTGTNYDRPDFLRMLEDVKRGEITCIVVKDLSRLGRNYIETGDYIEKIFPFLNVRFVAVNDSFDNKYENNADIMMTSLRNLINEYYAKDISRKIIQTFRTKQKNGEYIGLVAPYGYLKSLEDKHRFVKDDYAAPIVEQIFQLYADGKGMDAIAHYLNHQGVSSPRKYRYEIGITKSDRYKDSMWGRDSIRVILTNPSYLGHMVQGKVKQELCNNISKTYNQKEDWFIVENTHVPLINRELFDKAQKIYEEKSKKYKEVMKNSKMKGKKEENFLKGYLRCGCCGKGFNLAQNVSKSGKIVREYYCNGRRTYGEMSCVNYEKITKVKLETIVVQTIQGCILDLMDRIDILEKSSKQQSIDNKQLLEKRYSELKKCNKKIADVYIDYTDQLLSDSDYIVMKKEYSQQLEYLKSDIALLEKETECCKSKGIRDKNLINLIEEFDGNKVLSRKIVECFVDRILLFPKNRIQVILKCRDDILAGAGGNLDE